MDFFLSILNGNKWEGLIIEEVEAFWTTKGVSQYGQLDEVTFGFKVVEAAQLVHFTVLISCLSSKWAFSFKKLSKSSPSESDNESESAIERKDAIEDEMEVGRKLFNSEEFEGDKDAITEMMSNQMCDM